MSKKKQEAAKMVMEQMIEQDVAKEAKRLRESPYSPNDDLSKPIDKIQMLNEENLASASRRVPGLKVVPSSIPGVMLGLANAPPTPEDPSVDSNGMQKKHTEMKSSSPLPLAQKAHDLLAACLHGKLDVVREMVEEQGMSVKASSKEPNPSTGGPGTTPLHAACLGNQHEVVEYLVERKADVHVKREDGFTPIFVACKEGHLGITQYLLNKVPTPADGSTLLATACGHGFHQVVKALLMWKQYGLRNANPNDFSTTAKGLKVTALHVAAGEGLVPIMELLLDNGADPSLRDSEGRLALHTACVHGYSNAAMRLLDRSKEDAVFELDEAGSSPFVLACRHGRTSCVEALLRRVTIRPGWVRYVQLLLTPHVTVDAEGNIVGLSKHDMLDACSSPQSALYNACAGGHIGIMRMLLYSGAQGNGTRRGSQRLMNAVDEKCEHADALAQWLWATCGWNRLQYGIEARKVHQTNLCIKALGDSKDALREAMLPSGVSGLSAVDVAKAGREELGPLALPVSKDLVALLKRTSKDFTKEINEQKKAFRARLKQQELEENRKVIEKEEAEKAEKAEKKAKKRARQKAEREARRLVVEEEMKKIRAAKEAKLREAMEVEEAERRKEEEMQAEERRRKEEEMEVKRKKKQEQLDAKIKRKEEAEEAERRKREEAEAAVRKKKEEKEAAKKKKRELERKKKEEAEAAERKRREDAEALDRQKEEMAALRKEVEALEKRKQEAEEAEAARKLREAEELAQRQAAIETAVLVAQQQATQEEAARRQAAEEQRQVAWEAEQHGMEEIACTPPLAADEEHSPNHGLGPAAFPPGFGPPSDLAPVGVPPPPYATAFPPSFGPGGLGGFGASAPPAININPMSSLGTFSHRPSLPMPLGNPLPLGPPIRPIPLGFAPGGYPTFHGLGVGWQQQQQQQQHSPSQMEEDTERQHESAEPLAMQQPSMHLSTQQAPSQMQQPLHQQPLHQQPLHQQPIQQPMQSPSFLHSVPQALQSMSSTLTPTTDLQTTQFAGLPSAPQGSRPAKTPEEAKPEEAARQFGAGAWSGSTGGSASGVVEQGGAGGKSTGESGGEPGESVASVLDRMLRQMNRSALENKLRELLGMFESEKAKTQVLRKQLKTAVKAAAAAKPRALEPGELPPGSKRGLRLCSRCLEHEANMCIVMCGHQVCQKCSRNMINTGKNCHVCRKPITLCIKLLASP